MLKEHGPTRFDNSVRRLGEAWQGYCQLKSIWAAFLPRPSKMNAEQSMSDESVYGLIFGQIHLI
jgi:hypothetical protein